MDGRSAGVWVTAGVREGRRRLNKTLNLPSVITSSPSFSVVLFICAGILVFTEIGHGFRH